MWNPLAGLAQVNVKFKKLVDWAKMPTYGSEEAAGADLYASGWVHLPPGHRALVETGIAIQLPPGFEAQVRPRSGLAAKWGISVVNTPGTIDSDYRGEIKVILINHGTEHFEIKAGDRIAQLVVLPIFRAIFQEAHELTDSVRGEGGFGSTGR